MMEAQGGMKPDAGVAATSPEMVPEHCGVSKQILFNWGEIHTQPTILHFRLKRQSSKTQVMAANIAVKHVFQQAITALRFAPKADPPLKPNQPNQRMIVPSVTRKML
jgi:hypothetical protein